MTTFLEKTGLPKALTWAYLGVLIFMMGDGIEQTWLSRYITDAGFNSAELFSVYGITVGVSAWLSGSLSVPGNRVLAMLAAGGTLHGRLVCGRTAHCRLLQRSLPDGPAGLDRGDIQARAEIPLIDRGIGLVIDMEQPLQQGGFFIPAVGPDPVGNRQRPDDCSGAGQQFAGLVKD